MEVFGAVNDVFEFGSVLNAYSARFGIPSLSLSPRVSETLLVNFHASKLELLVESGRPGLTPFLELIFQSFGEFGSLPVSTSDGPLPSAEIAHGS